MLYTFTIAHGLWLDIIFINTSDEINKYNIVHLTLKSVGIVYFL